MSNIKNVNKYIDHTLLKADATEKEIEMLCLEAIESEFKSVCINPVWVSKATELLKESDVLVCTVVGFPLGANTLEVKKFETIDALNNGAKEIDMVINIGKFKAGDKDYVSTEIKELVKIVHDHEAILKVIIETCLLTNEEIDQVSRIVNELEAEFVKTSTGFSVSGAKLEDIKIMKEAVGNRTEIKASGGIKSWEFAKELIEAGATRIGASSGEEIVKEAELSVNGGKNNER